MRAKKNNRKSEAGYDRVIKYMGVFGGVQTLSNLITLVKGKLVAHFIGAAGMGIAYAFNRTIDLVSKTTDLGISFSAVKTISESTADEARQRQLLIVRSWSLWLGIIGTVAGSASTATTATPFHSSCSRWSWDARRSPAANGPS